MEKRVVDEYVRMALEHPMTAEERRRAEHPSAYLAFVKHERVEIRTLKMCHGYIASLESDINSKQQDLNYLIRVRERFLADGIE